MKIWWFIIGILLILGCEKDRTPLTPIIENPQQGGYEMPYKIVKEGNKWLVINKRTGHVKGTHDTKEKALRQLRLLQGIEHGWKPTKNK